MTSLMSSLRLRLIPSSPMTVLKSVCSIKPELLLSYSLNLLSSYYSVILCSCNLRLRRLKNLVSHSLSASTLLSYFIFSASTTRYISISYFPFVMNLLNSSASSYESSGQSFSSPVFRVNTVVFLIP